MSTYILRDNQIKENCIREIKSLSNNDLWVIDISNDEMARTTQQNKYYWTVLSIIGNEIGETKDDLHFHFAKELLGGEIQEYKGEKYFKPVSTTSLSKKAFVEYVDGIRAAVSAVDISFPTPNFYGLSDD